MVGMPNSWQVRSCLGIFLLKIYFQKNILLINQPVYDVNVTAWNKKSIANNLFDDIWQHSSNLSVGVARCQLDEFLAYVCGRDWFGIMKRLPMRCMWLISSPKHMLLKLSESVGKVRKGSWKQIFENLLSIKNANAYHWHVRPFVMFQLP